MKFHFKLIFVLSPPPSLHIRRNLYLFLCEVCAPLTAASTTRRQLRSERKITIKEPNSWFRSNEKLLYGCFAVCGGALFAMVQMRVQIFEGDQRTKAAAREGCVRATACCDLLSGARVLTNNAKQNAELRSDGAVGQVRAH